MAGPAERERFGLRILTSRLVPTNSPFTDPAVAKRTFETAGPGRPSLAARASPTSAAAPGLTAAITTVGWVAAMG